MQRSRVSNHPCHRLSVPAAKRFWCRHCMKVFEDAISRWRHSRSCRSGGFDNFIRRREMETQALQKMAETLDPDMSFEQISDVAGDGEAGHSRELCCFICRQRFMSLDEMREHVKYPCNKATSVQRPSMTVYIEEPTFGTGIQQHYTDGPISHHNASVNTHVGSSMSVDDNPHPLTVYMNEAGQGHSQEAKPTNIYVNEKGETVIEVENLDLNTKSGELSLAHLLTQLSQQGIVFDHHSQAEVETQPVEAESTVIEGSLQEIDLSQPTAVDAANTLTQLAGSAFRSTNSHHIFHTFDNTPPLKQIKSECIEVQYPEQVHHIPNFPVHTIMQKASDIEMSDNQNYIICTGESEVISVVRAHSLENDSNSASVSQEIFKNECIPSGITEGGAHDAVMAALVMDGSEQCVRHEQNFNRLKDKLQNSPLHVVLPQSENSMKMEIHVDPSSVVLSRLHPDQQMPDAETEGGLPVEQVHIDTPVQDFSFTLQPSAESVRNQDDNLRHAVSTFVSSESAAAVHQLLGASAACASVLTVEGPSAPLASPPSFSIVNEPQAEVDALVNGIEAPASALHLPQIVSVASEEVDSSQVLLEEVTHTAGMLAISGDADFVYSRSSADVTSHFSFADKKNYEGSSSPENIGTQALPWLEYVSCRKQLCENNFSCGVIDVNPENNKSSSVKHVNLVGGKVTSISTTEIQEERRLTRSVACEIQKQKSRVLRNRSFLCDYDRPIQKMKPIYNSSFFVTDSGPVKIQIVKGNLISSSQNKLSLILSDRKPCAKKTRILGKTKAPFVSRIKDRYLSVSVNSKEKVLVSADCTPRKYRFQEAEVGENFLICREAQEEHRGSVVTSDSPKKKSDVKEVKVNIPIIHKCKACGLTFTHLRLLRKHNLIPCRVQNTRNMCTKVLRSRLVTLNRSKRLLNRHAQKTRSKGSYLLSPIVLTAGTKKTKKKAKCQFLSRMSENCIQSEPTEPEIRLNDRKLYLSSLTTKEQFFFRIGLVSIHHVSPVLLSKHKIMLQKKLSTSRQYHKEMMANHWNQFAMRSSQGEDLNNSSGSVCCLSPPVLEPIDLKMSNTVEDLSFDLEPPILEPMVPSCKIISGSNNSQSAKIDLVSCMMEEVSECHSQYSHLVDGKGDADGDKPNLLVHEHSSHHSSVQTPGSSISQSSAKIIIKSLFHGTKLAEDGIIIVKSFRNRDRIILINPSVPEECALDLSDDDLMIDKLAAADFPSLTI